MSQSENNAKTPPARARRVFLFFGLKSPDRLPIVEMFDGKFYQCGSLISQCGSLINFPVEVVTAPAAANSRGE
jgi:hypothetical protein